MSELTDEQIRELWRQHCTGRDAGVFSEFYSFTRAVHAAGREAGLREAVGTCKELSQMLCEHRRWDRSVGADECAAAIRALIGEPNRSEATISGEDSNDVHQHTDACWEPDSGCDMGRSEEGVKRAADTNSSGGGNATAAADRGVRTTPREAVVSDAGNREAAASPNDTRDAISASDTNTVAQS